MIEISNEDASLVIGAIDSLGVALADHGHAWTDGERTIYEQAIAIMRNQTWTEETKGL